MRLKELNSVLKIVPFMFRNVFAVGTFVDRSNFGSEQRTLNGFTALLLRAYYATSMPIIRKLFQTGSDSILIPAGPSHFPSKQDIEPEKYMSQRSIVDKVQCRSVVRRG